ncbi:MAG: hypothetical protein QGI60_00950 [archaeon]|jgi:hypothetical protein|nr:hypothetical protein [archaeon]
MGFFKKRILTKKRKKALDTFRNTAIKALEELKGGSKDSLSKQIYAGMIQNVKHTPIKFFPRRSLRETIFSGGGRVFASVVKGEHVNQIKIFQKGNQMFVVKSDFINLPAGHVFKGDKLTIDGIFTLCHEYGHFPKPALAGFAAAHAMSYEQGEELFADILSAKLAVKMGYPKDKVLDHFSGRGIVYGRVPYRAFILKAIGK